MALTRKDKEQLNEVYEKHKRYYDLLFNSGGALYVGDIAKLLDINYLKCTRDVKKLEEQSMGMIDHVKHDFNKKVILLTEKGWRFFKKERKRCSTKDNVLRKNAYMGFVYEKMKEQSENHQKNVEYILNELEGVKELEGTYQKEWLEILNNPKFFINNIGKKIINFENQTDIELIYCTKEVFYKELLEYMEIFYRLMDNVQYKDDFKISLKIIAMKRPIFYDVYGEIGRKKMKKHMYIRGVQHSTKKMIILYKNGYRDSMDLYKIDEEFKLIKV